jgi:tetratricopeptide (TPR) repeat protein
MSWWRKIVGGSEDGQEVDYYREGAALQAEGKFHEALTSFRLALRESPGDAVILQQIAICYTRIGMTDEAAKTYRHVLQKDPSATGAHYGLAFLLLRAGQDRDALPHLKAFLAQPPGESEAQQHVEHARATLERLVSELPAGGGGA